MPAGTKNHENRPPAKPKNSERRSHEYLMPAEVKKLAFAAMQLGRHGFRDFVLITFAYRHPLRVGELVDLRWDQVHLKSARLHVNRLKNGEVTWLPLCSASRNRFSRLIAPIVKL
jgi:type 1 fimbriae regulatory protein FimB/type 1 fimbriae regulatory protein FimE